MLQLRFMAKMQARFLDRQVANVLAPKTRRFFMRAGGAIRKTARRSLKLAKQIPFEQLTEGQRARYVRSLRAFHSGQRAEKPKLPDQVSQPGQPPLLHNKQSLLKSRLFFALAADNRSIVIGPELVGRNKRPSRVPNQLTTIEELEKSRPFMEPAFDKIEPRLPTFWPKG